MNILLDYSTIKAGKRYDPRNPIAAAFHSLGQGIEAAGHTVIRTEAPTIRTVSDAVFVFGSVTDRKKDTERAKSIQIHRQLQTPIFSFDSGFFSTYIRQHYNTNQTGMFRLGFGDCVGGANWMSDNSTPDRFEAFKRQYNFEEKEPRGDNGKPILFILQSEKGWQYDEDEDFYLWARSVVARLRRITDRRIILRGHPNIDRNPTSKIAEGFDNIEIEQASRDRIGLLQSLDNCSCVVTHSSSSAIEAYVEGVPTFALSPRCVIYENLDNDLTKINDLSSYNWNNRQQNLYDFANRTWHIEELKDPKVVKRYLEYLEKR